MTSTRLQSDESSDEDLNTDPNYFTSTRNQKNLIRKKSRTLKPVLATSDEIEVLDVEETKEEKKKSESPQEKNKKKL